MIHALRTALLRLQYEFLLARIGAMRDDLAGTKVVERKQQEHLAVLQGRALTLLRTLNQREQLRRSTA